MRESFISSARSFRALSFSTATPQVFSLCAIITISFEIYWPKVNIYFTIIIINLIPSAFEQAKTRFDFMQWNLYSSLWPVFKVSVIACSQWKMMLASTYRWILYKMKGIDCSLIHNWASPVLHHIILDGYCLLYHADSSCTWAEPHFISHFNSFITLSPMSMNGKDTALAMKYDVVCLFIRIFDIL